ncbi:hypothetical protein LguiB_029695 [Lonicera macranthoides]
MEKNGVKSWNFKGHEDLITASQFSIKGVVNKLKQNLNPSDDQSRPVISLGHGDPSFFSCFPHSAQDAVLHSLRSAQFNGFPQNSGVLQARRSVAEYLSRDLPNNLSSNDVYLTAGAKQAIEVVLAVLARPGANILLPRPGYPMYEAHATFSHLEVRHFDILPEKGWEIDLNGLEALADDNTVAMVLVNPGNPCGNVFTYDHLQQVAETAKKLGILVIADEVYGHLAFGVNPFVQMGVFGSIVPVLTLGSLSKRWMVPGWRLGWIALSDPSGILEKYGIVECIKSYLSITSYPATFIQGAVPEILEKTTEDFYSKTIHLLREAADVCYDKLEQIPCISCPHKPEGSLFVMVKLDLSLLEDINDDMEFCIELAKEESVIIVPGFTVGLRNWLRITFAAERLSLEDGLERIKAFHFRHAKKQIL